MTKLDHYQMSLEGALATEQQKVAIISEKTPNELTRCPFCFLDSTFLYGNPDVVQLSSLNGVIVHDYDGSVVTVKTRYFPELATTSDELFMVREGHCHKKIHLAPYTAWKPARELSGIKRFRNDYVRDYLVVPKPKEPLWLKPELLHKPHSHRRAQHDLTSDDWMLIMGWYLAEGHTTKKELVFSMNPDDKDDCQELFSALRRVGLTYHVKQQYGEHGIQISANSRLLASNFRRWFGSRANQKVIPEFVMSAPKDKVSLFLLAYRKGDGNVRPNRSGSIEERYDTTSPVLARQVQYLLLRLGKMGVYSVHHVRAGMVNGRLLKPTTNYDISLVQARKTNRNWFFEDSENYYVPVTSIKEKHYSGKVYDFNTSDHMLRVPFLAHNCFGGQNLREMREFNEDLQLLKMYRCRHCHTRMHAESATITRDASSFGRFVGGYDSFWKKIDGLRDKDGNYLDHDSWTAKLKQLYPGPLLKRFWDGYAELRPEFKQKRDAQKAAWDYERSTGFKEDDGDTDQIDELGK